MTDRDFSTLEPVTRDYKPWHPSLSSPPPPSEMGIHARQEPVDANGNGMEVNKSAYHGRLDLPIAVPPYSPGGEQPEAYLQPLTKEREGGAPRRRNRRWLFIGLPILLLVILGAVLGGVLGSRKSGSSSSGSGSESGETSNSTIGGGNETETVAKPVHHIAAVGLESGESRVYYQDGEGKLMEAAMSGNLWAFTELGLLEKKYSPLAAAASRPGFPLEISVFYTDTNNELHDMIYTSTTQKWAEGVLGPKHYTKYPNSSIAGMYYQCAQCSNTTLVTFQDVNGFAIMAKKERGRWTSKQLDIDLLTPGTAFAMTNSLREGEGDAILLFHQKENGSLAMASYDRLWNSNPDTQIYPTGPGGTPISAISSYANTSSGFEEWRHMMKLSPNGIQVDTWLNGSSIPSKQDHQYTIFANASETNVKIYGSMAVTANRRAYAVVEQPPGNFSIQAYAMSDGFESWMGNGNVTVLEG